MSEFKRGVSKLNINFSFSGKKFIVGIIVLLVSMLLCFMGKASLKASLVLVLGCILFLLINIHVSEKISKWFNIIWYCFGSFMIFFSSQIVLNAGISGINCFKIILGTLICFVWKS